jgi:HEAT repeat protein
LSSEIKTLLDSSDEEARHKAVKSLSALPSWITAKEAVALLLYSFKDKSWRVRKAGIEVLLASYTPDEFLPGLVKLLYEDANAGARNSAAEAFVLLGSVATQTLASAYETDDVGVRKFIVDILGDIKDAKSIPLYIKALKDDDENVVASVVEHLGHMREPAVMSALVEIIDSGDAWTSYPAIDALGNIGSSEHIPILLPLLMTKMLREPTLRAIGKLGHEQEVPYIVEYLNDKSNAVKHVALVALENMYRKGASAKSIIKALAEVFGENVTTVILGFAKSDDHKVMDSAILFLGLLRDEQSLVPLLSISGDDRHSARVHEAFVSIGRNNPDALTKLIADRNAIETRFISDAMSEVASPVYFDPLVKLLGHYDGHVRSFAALGLANLGDVRATSYLLEHLDDQYEDVQEAVIRSLVRLKDGVDIDVFVTMLKNESPVLRRNALLLLGAVGTPHLAKTISFSLKDDDIKVRKSAVNALSRIGTEDSYSVLLGALADEDPSVRLEAVNSFGGSGREAFIAPVAELLKDPDEMVRASVCKVIGTLGNENHIEIVSGMLDDDNGFVVISAIETIGSFGGDKAYFLLLDRLESKDLEVRRTVIKTIAGYEGSVGRLSGYLYDDDWATRVAAAEALSQHKSDPVIKTLKDALDDERDPLVIKALQGSIDG